MGEAGVEDLQSSTDGTQKLNEEPIRRVRLLVAYDGSRFHGFAKNLGVQTVAGTLEYALQRILRHPVSIVGAGRTDKGVHAWGQVVAFDTHSPRVDPEKLIRALNGLCGPSILVRAAEFAEPGFDARFSARWRHYRYTLTSHRTSSPFLSPYIWSVGRDLVVEDMQQGALALVGQHDFSSFCRTPPSKGGSPTPTLVRRIHQAAWTELDEAYVRFDVVASAFCHQMVRSLVGTLVAMVTGRLRSEQIGSRINCKDRTAAGDLAPPHGLMLWQVGYADFGSPDSGAFAEEATGPISSPVALVPSRVA